MMQFSRTMVLLVAALSFGVAETAKAQQTAAFTGKPKVIRFCHAQRSDGTPERNLNNPFDAVGTIHNVVVERLKANVASVLLETPDTAPRTSVETGARRLFENTRRWRFNCLCASPIDCPCKDIRDLLFDMRRAAIRNPAILDEVLALFSEVSVLTRDEIRAIAQNRLPADEADELADGFDEIADVVEDFENGDISMPEAVQQLKSIEDGTTESALLQTAAVARIGVFNEVVPSASRVVRADIGGCMAGFLLGSVFGPPGALLGCGVGAVLYSTAAALE